MSDNDMVGEAPPECAIVALHDALAHSPDPLRTVADSATAFEDRLAFADDGAGPVIYHPERFLDERHAAQARAIWNATVERMGRHEAWCAGGAPGSEQDRPCKGCPDAARVAHGYEDQEA